MRTCLQKIEQPRLDLGNAPDIWGSVDMDTLLLLP